MHNRGSPVMATVNGSYVSPIADATIFPKVFKPSGIVASLMQDFTLWKTLVTFFLGAVLYDQCEYRVSSPRPFFFFPSFFSCPSR